MTSPNPDIFANVPKNPSFTPVEDFNAMKTTTLINQHRARIGKRPLSHEAIKNEISDFGNLDKMMRLLQ